MTWCPGCSCDTQPCHHHHCPLKRVTPEQFASRIENAASSARVKIDKIEHTSQNAGKSAALALVHELTRAGALPAALPLDAVDAAGYDPHGPEVNILHHWFADNASFNWHDDGTRSEQARALLNHFARHGFVLVPFRIDPPTRQQAEDLTRRAQ